LEFVENLESKDVFPVESPGLGMDDFPLLILELPADVEGDPSGETSTTSLSREIMLGRLLNCVRWTTVGSSCPLDRARESFRRRPGGLVGKEECSGSAKEALETVHSIWVSLRFRIVW
jgi:hypothetical protein